MSIAWVDAYDATGANAGALPVGQHAGYMTGSGDVPWSAAQIAADPGVVLIDQSPVDTPADETADVYDLEFRAGTEAGVAGWVRAAQYSYDSHRRIGQRRPCVYQSADAVTDTVNHLIAGGITSGVNLAVANYGLTRDEAISMVENAGGPFPVVWVQYEDAGLFDRGIMSVPWLKEVSVMGAPAKTIVQVDWRWCRKCQGLFYGPGIAESVCPAGGQHDATGSGQYLLIDVAS